MVVVSQNEMNQLPGHGCHLSAHHEPASRLAQPDSDPVRRQAGGNRGRPDPHRQQAAAQEQNRPARANRRGTPASADNGNVRGIASGSEPIGPAQGFTSRRTCGCSDVVYITPDPEHLLVGAHPHGNSKRARPVDDSDVGTGLPTPISAWEHGSRSRTTGARPIHHSTSGALFPDGPCETPALSPAPPPFR